MMGRIAAFELRQQLRSHVFWVVFAISCLMVFGSVTIEQLRVGPARGGLRNAASAVAQVHLLWSLFYLFTTTAFVADAVLRDDSTGFGPIIRSTPVGRIDYLIGRFAGAFGAALACFLSVPAAMALATLAPWLDPATVGPFQPRAYLFAFFVLAVPNLLLSAAAFFALATITRSMMAAYLAAVGLLVAYGLGSGQAGSWAAGPLAALLEPFGFAAYDFVTRDWTAAQRDARVAGLAGLLLWNRALWIGLAGALIALACARFRFETRAAAPRARDGSPAWAWRWPALAGADKPHGSPPGDPFAAAGGRRIRQRIGARAAPGQVAARTRLELGQVIRSPAFAVLALLAVFNAAGALWSMAGPDGAQAPPATGAVIERLTDSFGLVSITVAVFYAGELVWSERERGVHEIVGAAPVPDWAFVLPKVLAISLVLAAILLAGVATAVGIQAARGSDALELERYVREFLLPRAFDWILVAVLAVFFQAASPGKMAGWGWMVLYLIASLAMNRLGLNGSLYRYGSYPGFFAPGATVQGPTWPANGYRAYWAAFAVVLLVLAHAMWGRGLDGGLVSRLRRLPARLRGPAGCLGAAAAVACVALGACLLRQAGS